MKIKLFKACTFFLISFAIIISVDAQTTAGPKYFLKSPEAVNRLEDSLKKQFEKQNLVWPPQAMYLRSFKYDKQLEIWVKSSAKEPYKLFKTYKVCQQSGAMGPKRVEGDYQVPEGFYYINEFNPNSNYHLSLGLNYPNASDRILSDEKHVRSPATIFARS